MDAALLILTVHFLLGLFIFTFLFLNSIKINKKIEEFFTEEVKRNAKISNTGI